MLDTGLEIGGNINAWGKEEERERTPSLPKFIVQMVANG